MLTIPERLKDQNELYRKMMNEQITGLRVASPGIIESFNPANQTAVVQLAIREKININGSLEWAEIPPLPDVPVVVLGGGGYSITFPISAGDECLVVFGDNCMDAWWQSGGVQNQVDKRRHDLSDGYAIVGLRSLSRSIGGYSGTLQLRNDVGTAHVEIAGNDINLVGANVTVSASGSFNVNADSYSVTSKHSSINGGGTTVIDGKPFLPHTHGGIEPGGGNTSGVS